MLYIPEILRGKYNKRRHLELGKRRNWINVVKFGRKGGNIQHLLKNVVYFGDFARKIQQKASSRARQTA